jgi:Tfp pilus assembly protein PilN
MKEDINLLPPAVKKKRVRRLYVRRIRRLYWVLCVGLIMIGMSYGSVYFMLQQQMNVLYEEVATNEQDDREAERQVRTINTVLREIYQRAQEQQQWSGLADDVLRLVPHDATVATMSLRHDPKPGILVTGRAGSRSAVIEYERRLKELPWVEEVEAPLQNLASGTNIAFSFTLFRGDTNASP